MSEAGAPSGKFPGGLILIDNTDIVQIGSTNVNKLRILGKKLHKKRASFYIDFTKVQHGASAGAVAVVHITKIRL